MRTTRRRDWKDRLFALGRLGVLGVLVLTCGPALGETPAFSGQGTQGQLEDMSLYGLAPQPSPTTLRLRAKPAPPPLTPEQLSRRHTLPLDQFGFALFDPQTREWLDVYRPDTPFLPASVSKIPTTVAALKVLGADHRFETRFLSTAPVIDGVLKGDLYLVGGGDPTLDENRLALLIERLLASGVRSVEGRFFYDDTALAQGREIEPTQPEHLGYNVGFSALSLNFNRVQLVWSDRAAPFIRSALNRDYPDTYSVRRGTAPPPSGPRPSPFPAYETHPPSSGRQGDPQDAPRETWVLPPPWTGSGLVWLPVKAPGAYTATVCRALAIQKTLVLAPPRPAVAPSNAHLLAQVSSAPLDTVVRGVLASSNNLTAEILGLWTARVASGGESRDLASSAAVVQALFTTALPGVDWKGFFLANGSGLSSNSRMTPHQIVVVLDYATAPKGPLDMDYAHMLPQQSWQTDAGTPAKAQPVWAKTGTVYYGRGLAGVVETRSGRRLLFGVFTSDLDRRKTFDETNAHASGAQTAHARAWLDRARALERDLIQDWMRRY